VIFFTINYFRLEVVHRLVDICGIVDFTGAQNMKVNIFCVFFPLMVNIALLIKT
jgi:hypothetical protein